MKRVRKFGVFQTAKVSAVIYFLLSAVFMIPVALISTIMGGSEIPGFPFASGFLIIILPFFYGALGFIFTAMGCLVYNLVSGWTGGIEVEFESADQETLHELVQ